MVVNGMGTVRQFILGTLMAAGCHRGKGAVVQGRQWCRGVECEGNMVDIGHSRQFKKAKQNN